MKKQIIAEAYALERVMDYMSEGSFEQLARQDESFSRFINGVYTTLNDRATNLRRQASAKI